LFAFVRTGQSDPAGEAQSGVASPGET
jgi:hypothetical protein